MYASASVGWRWLVGAGLEAPDQGLAFQHFRAWAEQGDATALFNLGKQCLGDHYKISLLAAPETGPKLLACLVASRV